MREQYIGFLINGTEMAVPIHTVQEIMKEAKITELPQAPDYINGVTDIRGKVITIISLRKFIGISEAGTGEGQKIIILSRGHTAVGILVDDITGVIGIDSSNIEDPSAIVNKSSDLLAGIAKVDGRLISIVNTDRILLSNDSGTSEKHDDIVEVQELAGGKVQITKEVSTIGGTIHVKEIIDARDYVQKRRMDSGMDPRIYENMTAFLDAIESGEFERAETIMQQMVQSGSDGKLFKEVGRVTRKLHDSIKTFRDALDSKIKDKALQGMPSAVDGLHLVIDKTEESATKTLGIVENVILDSDGATSAIVAIEKALNGACAVELNTLRKFNNNVYDGMSEILIGQSFQDITGQTIRRVIKLIGELENELVFMVSTFGLKNDSEVPITTAGGNSHEQLHQEDVDSLLANCGF